jgi:hypothetical protein
MYHLLNTELQILNVLGRNGWLERKKKNNKVDFFFMQFFDTLAVFSENKLPEIS